MPDLPLRLRPEAPDDSSPEDLSDAALLAAHAAGDRRAFPELFERYRSRLRRIALGCSHTPEDADDAVQEAMLAAHRCAAGFRHDAAVGSWLHRIVVNACLDQRRRAAARPTAVLADPGWSVGDHTGRVDSVLVVRQALRELPAEQRAAVIAVDLQGHSVVEAAHLLGVAEGTVKSRRARARRLLAARLAGPGGSPYPAPPAG